jgi:hypothetical protein
MNDFRDPSEYAEASYTPNFFFDEEGGDLESGLAKTTYREASEKLIEVLNQSITFLAMHGYSKSKTLWGVAFALGHPLTAGMSMLEAGRMLGCTKQAISKISMDFLAHTGLPPSSSLKSEEAKTTYKITNGNRKQKPDRPDNTGGN